MNWKFLNIVLPWIYATEDEVYQYNGTINPLGNMRGRPKPGNSCQIEADCWSLTTCIGGFCHPYMEESISPKYIDDYIRMLCISDITLDEAFFYHSLVNVMDMRETSYGQAIVYSRVEPDDEKNLYYERYFNQDEDYLLTLTVDEWRTQKTNSVVRVDKLYGTPYWVAFCPV